MKQNETSASPKNAEKYYCKSCLHSCSKESDWKRHIITRKHKMKQNETKMKQNETIGDAQILHDNMQTKPNINDSKNDFMVSKNNKKASRKKSPPSFKCEFCNSLFQSRTTLWRHKKICLNNVEGQNINISNLPSKHEEDNNFKDVVLLMMKENRDFQKSFIELLPKMHLGVNNSNNVNYHNTNNFNINMFLNERCKNAMNLTDFINSLPITNETYDHTIENGLTKTITSMVVDGLNNMDILERPIHCTDPVRKTMYVKDNDVWEKDNELKLLLHGIKTLSFKQRTNLCKWQDANNGWDKDENLQTLMTKLVYNSMMNVEDDVKETNKIIRAIGKNTYLSNQIKDEFH
jgi:hypothetical protein